MTTITAPRVDLDLPVLPMRQVDWSVGESITADDIISLYEKHALAPRTGSETIFEGGTCAVGIVRVELDLDMFAIRKLWPEAFVTGVICGFDFYDKCVTRGEKTMTRGYELGREVRRLVFSSLLA